MELSFDELLDLPFADGRSALLNFSRKNKARAMRGNPKRGGGESSFEGGFDIRTGLDYDGFKVVRPSWNVKISDLAESVKNLEHAGYPATFLLMEEHVWDMARTLTNIVQESISDSLVCNMVSSLQTRHRNLTDLCTDSPMQDILAWLIDPCKGQAGFSPHRDRQPNDVLSSFSICPTTGFYAPKYLTFWVALRQATPSSSCMYMIPKHIDPGYMSGDDNDIDPLQRCLKSKEDYQHIRAFPLESGEAVCFSHRTLHWGSKGSALDSSGPRISVAFAFSDPKFEMPYFDLPRHSHPSPELRLALICGQMICYHERFSFSSKKMNFFKKCFDIEASNFNKEYKNKVCSEFIAAVMENEFGCIQPEKENDKLKSMSGKKRKRGVELMGQNAVVASALSSDLDSDEDEIVASVFSSDLGSSEDAIEAVMEQILDGDREGSYFVGNDDYEDSDDENDNSSSS